MKNPIILFVFLLTILTGCSPVRVVSTQSKPGVDLSAYNTYNFLDVSLKSEQMQDEDSEGIHLLKNAIAEQMDKRGFTQSSNPELWLNIGIVTQQKVQTRQTTFREAPRYIGQRRYKWESQEVVVDRYTLGTVTLDVVDAAQDERIWSGVVEGSLTDQVNKLEKRIHTGIKKLFTRFPVKAE